MTKIVLTSRSMTGNGRGGRIYVDKEKITEVYESESGNGCTIYLNSKSAEYLQVAETFDEVKALIDYEPEVADIFIKGKELS